MRRLEGNRRCPAPAWSISTDGAAQAENFFILSRCIYKIMIFGEQEYFS